MSAAEDFLVEVGTEELPPKALRSLMAAFGQSLEAAVDEARLEHEAVHCYASPRRLTVLIENLEHGQGDRTVSQKGPPISIAFDDDGNVTPAGSAFAKKCGVAVTDLGRTKTDKGEWLSCDIVEPGKTSAELLPPLIERALATLPIPRRMRWGASEAEFVRPIHWVVLLHGDEVLDASIMGIAAGNLSRGHRFHCDKPVVIKTPAAYLTTLEKDGRVIADFERRREIILSGVNAEAERVGGSVVDAEVLLDEVAALVEWPVPLTGAFDEKYLELPREVVISTLTSHQRYFAVADKDGALLPHFITIANLESKDPDQVRDGNERVIRPRLADAAFFWDSDRRLGLTARKDALRDVVYQRGLGNLGDKSDRTANLAGSIAGALDVDAETVRRAAELSKCDLLTGMVGEFPELQGTMGSYYAEADGESKAIAIAIGDHYHPRFAGDALPTSVDGQILAVADKLDSLAGIFSIGKKPSGNRDPFGLRRSALGIVRVLVECDLDVDLKALIKEAVDAQPEGKIAKTELYEALYTYITERLRRYFLDRDVSLATETFDAVLARSPASLVDFGRRLGAVQAFLKLDAAESLAAANKRIANILRQADNGGTGAIKEKLLTDEAEQVLWKALGETAEVVSPLLAGRDYTSALTELAGLRTPIDSFFDDVMVMADDDAIRSNRLALLAELRALFLGVADISRLAI
jgi:glycyl-tRNA synthetase beta chain